MLTQQRAYPTSPPKESFEVDDHLDVFLARVKVHNGRWSPNLSRECIFQAHSKVRAKKNILNTFSRQRACTCQMPSSLLTCQMRVGPLSQSVFASTKFCSSRSFISVTVSHSPGFASSCATIRCSSSVRDKSCHVRCE